MRVLSIARLLLLNAAGVALFLFFIESTSHIVLTLRDGSGLSSLALAERLKRVFSGSRKGICGDSDSCEKLEKVMQGKDSRIYSSYLFDPSFHPIGEKFWFGHPVNATIVSCREDEGLISFSTNSLGFRRVLNQDVSTKFQVVLLGDSFAEGACVKDGHTLADRLAEDLKVNVLGLGRGGTGPLFQLALLKEILANKALSTQIGPGTKVLWLLFSGNDLWNLKDEKLVLSGYGPGMSGSQGYFDDLSSIALRQEAFLDEMRDIYWKHGVPASGSRPGYGRSGGPLSHVGEVKKELREFGRVFIDFSQLVRSVGADPVVVMLSDHPHFHKPFMNALQSEFRTQCQKEKIECLEVGLLSMKDYLAVNGTGHLNALGYQMLARKIQPLLVKK